MAAQLAVFFQVRAQDIQMPLGKRLHPIVVGYAVGVLPQLHIKRIVLRLRGGEIQHLECIGDLLPFPRGGEGHRDRPFINPGRAVSRHIKCNPDRLNMVRVHCDRITGPDHVGIGAAGSVILFPIADKGVRLPDKADIHLPREYASLPLKRSGRYLQCPECILPAQDRDLCDRPVPLPRGERGTARLHSLKLPVAVLRTGDIRRNGQRLKIPLHECVPS